MELYYEVRFVGQSVGIVQLGLKKVNTFLH